MAKLEHIGIAVKDLQATAAIFRTLLGSNAYKEELVESEGVRTLFFQLENVKIELLEATTADSPIARFIEKRGEGLHHIALEPSIELNEQHSFLQSTGFELLNTHPKDGADNKEIFFVHPKSAGGVLVEFCQEKKSL